MESNQQANSAADEVAFIDDLPVESDEFEGGSHARVAAAIVDTIKANDGGRAIGLEGTWGSGKSSVIEIASNQLAKEKGPDNSKHAVLVGIYVLLVTTLLNILLLAIFFRGLAFFAT